jgi:hypothetical protein
MKIYLRIVALAALVFLAGCGSVSTRQRLSELEESLRTYGKLLRWGEYEAALKYMVRREAGASAVDLGVLRNVRITTYDVLSRTVEPDNTEALIRVKIDFYDADYARLRSLMDVQTWWYSEEHERWFLDDTLPDFQSAPAPAK